MFGDNPIRKPLKGDGTTLEVKEIFSTLQGEGPLAGEAAIFIRLGGCNLACAFCDTAFEDFAAMTLEEIIAQTKSLAQEAKLIVITGGEPLRQPIAKLCEALIAEGFSVQIETNGTIYRPLPKEVQIVCSPKAGSAGYHPIREDLLPHLTALKFLISTTHPHYNHVPDLGQSHYNIPVYVQPMDEQNETSNTKNLEKTIALAEKHGYALSLQTHKLFAIP